MAGHTIGLGQVTLPPYVRMSYSLARIVVTVHVAVRLDEMLLT